MNLKQIIAFYENRVKQLEVDLEQAEDDWEAWPSGEMNESQVPIDRLNTEIDTLKEILQELIFMKYEKPRRSFGTKPRKLKGYL